MPHGQMRLQLADVSQLLTVNQKKNRIISPGRSDDRKLPLSGLLDGKESGPLQHEIAGRLHWRQFFRIGQCFHGPKVSQLKSMIDAGTYSVEPGDFASKLLEKYNA